MRAGGGDRPPEVADGVFGLGTRWVNFYCVVDGRAAILVDAGHPRYTGQLDASLAALGRRISEVEAAIVTHHHVDHAGTAAYTHRAGATVYVTEGDASIVRGERPSHPPAGFYREVATPGHTAGHCSGALPDRGVLLAGDAMVNFDYASGAQGLRLHRFNEDHEAARRSLARFDDLDVATVLFGHGEPWTKGLPQAVEAIRTTRSRR